MNIFFKKNAKYIRLILGFILGILVLSNVHLRSVLKWKPILCVKDNLDFIGSFINKYPWLITVLIIIAILTLWAHNFSFVEPTINIFGVEFQVRNTEENVRIHVKNYLITKRSMFVYYEKYDNAYDSINSVYACLSFLREELASFDNDTQTKKECYLKVEELIKVLGKFLTKHQSDYRRYYENYLQRENDRFVPFIKIQSEYVAINELLADFRKLNAQTKPYAEYFGVDLEKWNNWYVEDNK